MKRTAVVLGTLAILAAMGTGAAAAPAPPPGSDRLVRQHERTGAGVLALDWGDLDDTPNAAAGDFLVMEPWEYGRIRALRADNPHLRILMYKDASAVVKGAHETGIYPTGVSYQEADARHPGWFLTDASGHRLEWSDWQGLYPMNVGKRSYQRTWAGNVLKELRAHDWDGVMLDDTLTYLSHSTVRDRTSTRIPNDAAMYRATGSFLAQVGPRLQDAGFLAVPNVTIEWNTWRSTLADWSRHVSGWENEYFVKWGLERQPRFQDADWEWKMQMSAWCADRRIPLLAITYSNQDDRATQTYHRATWLLTWNGATGAGIFVPSEVGASHWAARANTSVGAPTGAREHADGVWTRTYERGVVLVNPTTAARTVAVGDGYEDGADDPVRTVHLAPLTGAILHRS